MIKIKLDKAIDRLEDDKLGLEYYITRFVEKYVDSNYKGSILLTGKWGIGKTSYLNLIKRKSAKKHKFVNLDFWNNKSTNRFYSEIFKKTHSILYYVFQPLLILSIILLAIISGTIEIINLIYKVNSSLSTNMLTVLIVLLILNPLLHFIKDQNDMELIYRKMFLCIPTRGKIIFILDDFDRIEQNKKDSLYSCLSDLNSFDKSVVIVVGEYKSIVEDSSNIFTQKILKHIEYMPIKYNSKRIWENFESELNDIISHENITNADKMNLKRIRITFINENRTYRESIQLLNYFESVYVNKANKQLNPSEALSLCYIFAFYNDIYEIISHQLISEIALSNKNNNENEKRDKIDNIFNARNIIVNNDVKQYIYYNFNHFHHDEMAFPSITDARNYELYQIENDDRTEVNCNVIKQYIDSDKENAKNILDNLDYIDFERFFIMYRDRMLTGQAANGAEMYLKEMDKLAYYIFKGNYGEYIVNDYNFSKQESVLFNDFSRILDDNFKIDKEEQYKKNIENDTDLDDSQKLILLNKFAIDAGENKADFIVDAINDILTNVKFSDVQNMQFPWYIYWFYKKYYSELKEHNLDIDSNLSEICKLDNETFFSFIKDKFVINNTAPNNKRHYLSLDDICFNNEFRAELEYKIKNLNSSEREEIEQYINNSQKSY